MNPPNYLYKLTHLRVAKTSAKGEAPYKPALLLAVIEGIEEGTITDNQIRITPELIAAFKSICTLLSPFGSYSTNNFSLPFYHLTGDGFWQLVALPGRELVLTSSNSVKSFRSLQDTIDYAQLDAPLYQLLLHSASREELRQAILVRYFPQTRHLYRPGSGHQLLSDITHQILEETPFTQMTGIASNDELYVEVRSGLFKKEIIKQYDHTCAISGLRIVATTSVSMIDACHIIPWSQSKDDTIGNGIALCPNLHRAFDRHLISIDENYRVQVASHFTETTNNPYGIRQFDGKRLILPNNKSYWPSRLNIRHRLKSI
jgi:putative restriction endonuclease